MGCAWHQCWGAGINHGSTPSCKRWPLQITAILASPHPHAADELSGARAALAAADDAAARLTEESARRADELSAAHERERAAAREAREALGAAERAQQSAERGST